MKFSSVRDLKNKTSEILRLAARDTVVITSHGKPRAVILGVTEKTFEEYISAKESRRNTRAAKVAESSVDTYLPRTLNSSPQVSPEFPVSPPRLKAVFWDYPDLAEEDKFSAFLRKRREMNDAWALEWALTRFLEHGRAVDAMKYFPLDEIRQVLPRLRLTAYTRKKWNRLLEVYGNDPSRLTD